jgi:hypothetical protein
LHSDKAFESSDSSAELTKNERLAASSKTDNAFASDEQDSLHKTGFGEEQSMEIGEETFADGSTKNVTEKSASAIAGKIYQDSYLINFINFIKFLYFHFTKNRHQKFIIVLQHTAV